MPSFSTAILPSLRISSRPVVEAALSTVSPALYIMSGSVASFLWRTPISGMRGMLHLKEGSRRFRLNTGPPSIKPKPGDDARIAHHSAYQRRLDEHPEKMRQRRETVEHP